MIEKWPCLEHAIADGGQGHERGVKWANEARREAQEPETDSPAAITMGLDVFHTQREWERVLQRQWNRVERQMEAASKADAKVEQAKRRGQDTRDGGRHRSYWYGPPGGEQFLRRSDRQHKARSLRPVGVGRAQAHFPTPCEAARCLTPVAYGLSKIEIWLNLPCCKSFNYSNFFI